MKRSTILDHIESSYIALPELQQSCIWTRDQVLETSNSLYKCYTEGELEAAI